MLNKNPHQFTGRQFDEESGMYHYRARSYDAEAGRFLQQDPAGMIDGANMYAYVGNNPVNGVDPSGKFNIFIFFSGFNSIEQGTRGDPINELYDQGVLSDIPGFTIISSYGADCQERCGHVLWKIGPIIMYDYFDIECMNDCMSDYVFGSTTGPPPGLHSPRWEHM